MTKTRIQNIRLILMGVIGITTFIVLFRASNQLTCERLEKSHVNCQYQREYLLGLFSSSSPPFRLSTFDLKTKEVTYTDSDGNSHTTLHYHAYLTPKRGNEIFFHDYRGNYSLALKDQSKLIELGINQGSSEITLERSFFF